LARLAGETAARLRSDTSTAASQGRLVATQAQNRARAAAKAAADLAKADAHANAPEAALRLAEEARAIAATLERLPKADSADPRALAAALDKTLAERVAAIAPAAGGKPPTPALRTGTELAKLNAGLRSAVARNDAQTTETLLDQGADPNATDDAGVRPVIEAAWRGRTRLVEILIARGTDVEATDPAGRTALAWAATNGHADLARRLLAAKARTDRADHDGVTPLMRAAWNGHLDVVNLLLAAGADRDRRDGRGKSALDRAREQGDGRAAALLEKR
jgi:hypothetical protein